MHLVMVKDKLGPTVIQLKHHCLLIPCTAEDRLQSRAGAGWPAVAWWSLCTDFSAGTVTCPAAEGDWEAPYCFCNVMDLNSMQLHAASYAPVPFAYHQSFALLQKSIFGFLMLSSVFIHAFLACRLFDLSLPCLLLFLPWSCCRDLWGLIDLLYNIGLTHSLKARSTQKVVVWAR